MHFLGQKYLTKSSPPSGLLNRLLIFSPSYQEGGDEEGVSATNMVQIRNKRELKLTRAKLRKNMPAPEAILWQKIRSGQLGVKFRRQFCVNNFVLDFYSSSTKLAVEIDGDSHFTDQEARLKDEKRDRFLLSLGIKVIRFTNKDIMENLDGIIGKIIEEIPPLSLPLFREQGEKIAHK